MKIDANSIPKYVNKLPIPYIFSPQIIRDPDTNCVISHDYVITVSRFFQQMLPLGYPQTELFGYGGMVECENKCCSHTFIQTSVPGPVILATRGIPVNIKWVNNLCGRHPFPIDPTIYWADPNNIRMINPNDVPPFPPGLSQAQRPIPIVTHLHGAETSSVFDGHPEAWFTANEDKIGPTFTSSTSQYLNKQPSANLWYHDNTLGITRLNVYYGLYGPYIINDSDNILDYPGRILPSSEYDIPLVLKDYTFNDDGSLWFPNQGDLPDVHPYWLPEFFGETNVVNGKVWPNLNVKRRLYRFRLLNGANARFYNLYFSNNMEFIQIGSDGGYLPEVAPLRELLIAPGERADILVDFSKLEPGTKIVLENNANAPYPDGEGNFDPETTGKVMQFTVMDTCEKTPKELPQKLNEIPVLKPNAPNRTLVLVEAMMDGNPTGIFINGQKFSAPVTEMPLVGSTEEWEIVNLTGDAHPIHLHLVQFLIKNRQSIDADLYSADWMELNGMPPLSEPTKILPIDSYLNGPAIAPPPNEAGWKDTAVVLPGQVMRLTIRFAPQYVNEEDVMPGVNLFPFSPCVGPGYVWHCHILDHEDNEMMRPYIVMCNDTMHKDNNK